jgi:ABC-type Mn2+/Zn2+ transport system permease subunit
MITETILLAVAMGVAAGLMGSFVVMRRMARSNNPGTTASLMQALLAADADHSARRETCA